MWTMQHIEQIVEHIAGGLNEITREDLLWGGMGVAVADDNACRVCLYHRYRVTFEIDVRAGKNTANASKCLPVCKF